MIGVVTWASGFAKLTFSLIDSYPAATVPDVHPYATQSNFSSGKISLVTSVMSSAILASVSLVSGL